MPERNIEPYSSLPAPRSEEPVSSHGSDDRSGPVEAFWETLAILTIVFMLVIVVNITLETLQSSQMKPPAHNTIMSPAGSAEHLAPRN
ncbi:hypothetical protein F2P47_09400 [Parvibaculum sedimenti]|uniref:Uncharacterized protein n=1 Tax=Parvibaculum sedimenti TaxID=2608632 RepID=A0A6N6VHH6_9HYPH|nr:hypothetical protein [Parvibaculum sedimenti]KAB7740211.1 hypothetical protein F2P47_09400 [Parvibaculum sedimenti]